MDAPVVVHRSPHPLECADRALVLSALGIPCDRSFDGEQHALSVPAAFEHQALEELTKYAGEADAKQRAARIVIAPPPDLPHAGWGVVGFALVLGFTSVALARGYGPLDAFSAGELAGDGVTRGQWWRAITALTLHRDPGHLLGNLLFGGWIGYFAGARLGYGLAWLATLLAAATANLFDAALGPPDYRSVGASTAVFAALGLLCALGWRERHAMGRRGFARLSPLVAGVILLGWTGSEGEHTDLAAHGLGFLCGLGLGALLAVPRIRERLARLPQWPAGIATLALLGLAWWLALNA
jgi:membrane associated rhomboid family serine protease